MVFLQVRMRIFLLRGNTPEVHMVRLPIHVEFDHQLQILRRFFILHFRGILGSEWILSPGHLSLAPVVDQSP